MARIEERVGSRQVDGPTPANTRTCSEPRPTRCRVSAPPTGGPPCSRRYGRREVHRRSAAEDLRNNQVKDLNFRRLSRRIYSRRFLYRSRQRAISGYQSSRSAALKAPLITSSWTKPSTDDQDVHRATRTDPLTSSPKVLRRSSANVPNDCERTRPQRTQRSVSAAVGLTNVTAYLLR